MKKKKQKFTVKIEEVWIRTIEVEAENEEEANDNWADGTEIDFSYSKILDWNVNPGWDL